MQDPRQPHLVMQQVIVSCSSAEAEYRATVSATSELIWLCSLLRDLQIDCSSPTYLHCNNQVTLHIAANLVFHERTKYIDIDCHFIQEHVNSRIIIISHVSSMSQIADIFIKPLGS
jgi:hypothetical protein